MRTWIRPLRQRSRRPRSIPRTALRLMLEGLEDRCLPSGFVQTALVSDMPGLAPHTDPALVNPWGFTLSSRGDFLISDNNGGNAALFAPNGTALGAPIVMPPPGGSPAGSTGAPTGQVLNSTSDFVISEGSRSAPASALFS